MISNMFEHKYPITNLHEVDLTTYIMQVNELKILFDSIVNGKLTEALEKYFNSFMIDAIYHEDLREIELKKEVTVADGIHTYNADDNSMSIGG